MRKFRLVRNHLAVQMVLWFALISLVPLGLVTYFNYKNAANALHKMGSENLWAIAQRQSSQIKDYLRDKEQFVSILSLTPEVVRPLAILKKVKKGRQDAAQVEEIRRSYEPILRGFVKQFGFRQIFLINTNGSINLSVGEDPPLYNDLTSGTIANTQLAHVYEQVMMFMTPQISDLAIFPPTQQPALFLGAPVLHEDKLVGVLVLQLEAKTIYSIAENYNGLGKTGETIIGSIEEGEITILNPTRQAPDVAFNVKKSSDEYTLALDKALKGQRGAGEAVDYRGKEVLAAWEYLPKIRWGLVVKMDKEETLSSVLELRQMATLIGLGTLFIVLTIAILVAGSITQPIIALTQVATKIAKGDLSPVIGKTPENEIGLLADAIKVMAKNLKSLVGQVKKSGNQLVMTTVDVSSAVQSQSEAAQQTGAASLEITALARRISSTAKELAGTMQEVSEVAQDTALLAESGIDGLQAMENSMGELAEANVDVSKELSVIQEKANAISGIINTMTKVADQTNLLSLNASIEAKQAGEFGRGFKIVSQEIRRLADQAASSTLEIETMIGEMLTAVHNGVRSMQHLSSKVEYGVTEITTISSHLGNVIQQVQGLPPRFEMVLQNMEMQSDRADQIKDSITQLSRSAQTTVQSLEETKDKLSLLDNMAGSLQKEISIFRTD